MIYFWIEKDKKYISIKVFFKLAEKKQHLRYGRLFSFEESNLMQEPDIDLYEDDIPSNDIPSNDIPKKRCGDMRHLSIEKGEQTAQIIVVNDFYDSLETMKSYRESMDAIPKEFEDKWKELQGILEEAKVRWEEKFGRSLCERVSNLLKRKRE